MRPAVPDDAAFLFALYADRRMPELAPLGWDAAQRAAFLEMQFRAQQEGYGAEFADADHWIVLVDGEPAGRLLVARRPAAYVVVDIVVLARHRRRGIGTALMGEVQASAAEAGAAVNLHVAGWDTGVVEWYERLGFTRVSADGAHVAMSWSSSSASVSPADPRTG